jgi:hypothetical protein
LRNRLGIEQELEKSRGLISADFDSTGAETRETLSGKSTEEFDLGTDPFAITFTTRSLFNLKGALRSVISSLFRKRRYAALSLILFAAFGLGFGFYGFYRYLASKWRPTPRFDQCRYAGLPPAVESRARPSRRTENTSYTS